MCDSCGLRHRGQHELLFAAHADQRRTELRLTPLVPATLISVPHPFDKGVLAVIQISCPVYCLTLCWQYVAGPLRIRASDCIVALGATLDKNFVSHLNFTRWKAGSENTARLLGLHAIHRTAKVIASIYSSAARFGTAGHPVDESRDL